ncbi:MAG: 6-phosphogluconolactonase [Methylobacteriaceae bacterium]|nr:6-phosphogluconolactonase [Methylobacteriaceae bacterium]
MADEFGELIVFPDADALARGAALWLKDRLAPLQGRIAIALSGGSTPRRLFQLMGSEFKDEFPWERMHFFWGDERFVPHDDPDSNFHMANEALLSKIVVPSGNIQPVPTENIAPEESARAYEHELQAFYGATALQPGKFLFDVQLLGLGEDGHTASLIPGQPVLDERTRWVAPVSQGRPETRITLTYPPIESSRHIAFLISGAAKRDALHKVRARSADLPAARLRPEGDLTFLVDRAAAGEAG